MFFVSPISDFVALPGSNKINNLVQSLRKLVEILLVEENLMLFKEKFAFLSCSFLAFRNG